jgi:hypothetical protein
VVGEKTGGGQTLNAGAALCVRRTRHGSSQSVASPVRHECGARASQARSGTLKAAHVRIVLAPHVQPLWLVLLSLTTPSAGALLGASAPATNIDPLADATASCCSTEADAGSTRTLVRQTLRELRERRHAAGRPRGGRARPGRAPSAIGAGAGPAWSLSSCCLCCAPRVALPPALTIPSSAAMSLPPLLVDLPRSPIFAVGLPLAASFATGLLTRNAQHGPRGTVSVRRSGGRSAGRCWHTVCGIGCPVPTAWTCWAEPSVVQARGAARLALAATISAPGSTALHPADAVLRAHSGTSRCRSRRSTRPRGRLASCGRRCTRAWAGRAS